MFNFLVVWFILVCGQHHFEQYSEYENCLINLNNATVDHDKVDRHGFIEDMYNQSNCKNKTKYFYRSIKIPEGCYLGSGHQIISYFAPVAADSRKDCRYHSIFDRPTILHTQQQNTLKETKNFIHTLLHYNYTRFVSIGDSVAMQLARFIGCDILRDGIQILDNCGGSLLSMSKNGGCSTINILHNNHMRQIVMYTVRFQDLCIYHDCTVNTTEHIRQIVHSVIRFHAISYNNTALLFNVGLHMTDDVPNNTLVLESFAEHFLELGKELKARQGNSVLLFRETTGQHFPSQTGYYERNIVLNSTEYCCRSISASISNSNNVVLDRSINKITEDNNTKHIYDTIDYRDKHIYKHLSNIDPQWHNYIIWIKFFEYTRSHYSDMHLEIGNDCTHYMYNPSVNSISNKLMQELATSIHMYHRLHHRN